MAVLPTMAGKFENIIRLQQTVTTSMLAAAPLGVSEKFTMR
jgi:hypothetical protein